MIYFCCALYKEAEDIIKYYKMKKVDVSGRYQFFETSPNSLKHVKARLVVCGTGAANANAAVTMLCTRYAPCDSDIFVNFGSCGADAVIGMVGDVLMAYGVRDALSGKVIHTDIDILCKAEFEKVMLATFPKPVKDETLLLDDICDMEAYGAVFAASLFFETHRIFVIKVISDIIGDSDFVSKESLSSVIYWAHHGVVKYLDDAAVAAEKLCVAYGGIEFSDIEIEAIEKFCKALSLSEAMVEQLYVTMRRRKILGKSVILVIEEFCIKAFEGRERKKVSSKQEGKTLFKEFKEYERSHD